MSVASLHRACYLIERDNPSDPGCVPQRQDRLGVVASLAVGPWGNTERCRRRCSEQAARALARASCSRTIDRLSPKRGVPHDSSMAYSCCWPESTGCVIKPIGGGPQAPAASKERKIAESSDRSAALASQPVDIARCDARPHSRLPLCTFAPNPSSSSALPTSPRALIARFHSPRWPYLCNPLLVCGLGSSTLFFSFFPAGTSDKSFASHAETTSDPLPSQGRLWSCCPAAALFGLRDRRCKPLRRHREADPCDPWLSNERGYVGFFL